MRSPTWLAQAGWQASKRSIVRNDGLRSAAVLLLVLFGLVSSADSQCTIDRHTPPMANPFEQFGASVSISGGAAIVGAPGNDASGIDAGSAMIYRLNAAADAWPLQQTLAPVSVTPDDAFGAAVSIDGDRAIVGAPKTGVAGPNTGNARVFKYLPASALWSQVNIVVSSDSEAGDEFGSAVAISGDAALVGAPLEDENGADAGAVYAFRLDPGSGLWLQQQKLLPIDTMTGDRFGGAVSLDGDVAVVGASGASVGSGALYVYRYDPILLSWQFEQRVTPSDAAQFDQFATSVAVSDGRILAGSFRDDDGGADSGSATTFVFDELSQSWLEETKILSPDTAAGDRFGIAVALSGSRAVIGATGDDPEGFQSGGAYLFVDDPINGWTFAEELFDEPEGLEGDGFGSAIAIDETQILIGAGGHDGAAGTDSGVARFFETGGEDCNENGISDRCDLLSGASVDFNLNEIPDECDFVFPVTGLTCTTLGEDLSIVWTNGEAYDLILISIDVSAALELPGESVSFSSLGLAPGFHTVAVVGVTDLIHSAAETCTATIDPPPITGLSCAPGDPCLFEALLTWDPVDPAITSIEIALDGTPLGSFSPNSLGAGISTVTGGSHDLCVTTRIAGVDPESGLTFELDSVPVCCTVTIDPVTNDPVEDLTCTVSAFDCSALIAWNLGSAYSQIEVLLDNVLLFDLDGAATSVLLTLPEGQTFSACVRATTICGFVTTPVCCDVTCGPEFVRGDSNADGLVDLSDPIATLNFLFIGGSVPCDAAADSNGDDAIDLSDTIYLLGYLFGAGAPPPAPHPNCGAASGALGCESFAPCP